MYCVLLLKTYYEIFCEDILMTSRNLHPLLTGFLEQGKPLNAASLTILEIDYGILRTPIIYVSIKKDGSLIKPVFEDSCKNDKELSIAIHIMF